MIQEEKQTEKELLIEILDKLDQIEKSLEK